MLAALRGSSAAYRPDLDAVRANGRWTENDGWRISTVTTSTIETVKRPWREIPGSPARYFKYGWASWAATTRLEAGEAETVA